MYRPDRTDPLEIILAQRRLMWRALLVTLFLTAMRWGCHSELLQGNSPIGWRVSTPAARSLSVADVERSLARAIVSPDPVLNATCVAGDEGGWNYVCAYQIDPANPAARVKVGVKVGSTRILQVSPPQVIGSPLPPPWRPGGNKPGRPTESTGG